MASTCSVHFDKITHLVDGKVFRVEYFTPNRWFYFLLTDLLSQCRRYALSRDALPLFLILSYNNHFIFLYANL